MLPLKSYFEVLNIILAWRAVVVGLVIKWSVAGFLKKSRAVNPKREVAPVSVVRTKLLIFFAKMQDFSACQSLYINYIRSVKNYLAQTIFLAGLRKETKTSAR